MCGGVKKWHKFSKRLDEFSCVIDSSFGHELGSSDFVFVQFLPYSTTSVLLADHQIHQNRGHHQKGFRGHRCCCCCCRRMHSGGFLFDDLVFSRITSGISITSTTVILKISYNFLGTFQCVGIFDNF